MISSKGQESFSKALYTFPPENSLLCWLFSMGTAPHKNMVLWWTVHKSEVPSWHLHLVWHGILPWSKCRYQLHCSSPCALGQSVFATGLLGNLLWCLDHLLPHLLHHCWCLWGCFLNIVFLTPLSSSAVWHFYAFYKILSQTSHHLGWVCWSPLEPFLVQSCPSFSSQRWTLQSHTARTWALVHSKAK